MIFDKIKIWPQYILPQHLLTKIVGKLANSTFTPWKNFFIKHFINFYKVDMQLAQQSDYTQYPCFNDFFIRRLKAELRPIDVSSNSLASPVDGGISQICKIAAGQIYNVKQHSFELLELLANDPALAANYQHGSYLSLYLSPRDYHRVHMPITGRLIKMTYVPGKLFSVSNKTLAAIPGVFAKNERLIIEFATDLGPMLLILVGAMIAASMNTVWHGEIAREKNVRQWSYPAGGKDALLLAKGDEVGHFKLGSTVILLFPDHSKLEYDNDLLTRNHLIYGEKIAEFI